MAYYVSNISQKYHSIHARGEKVEKVLADFANGNQPMEYVSILFRIYKADIFIDSRAPPMTLSV